MSGVGPQVRSQLEAAVSGRDLSPAGWDKIHAFESRHGIVLPEPCRTFFAEIAESVGDGPPHYGLFPLDGQRGGWASPDSEERFPAQLFPLTEAWIWEDDEDADQLYDQIEAVFTHGSVVLGTDGCGMCWNLVTTGPHRGIVWNIADVGAQPFGSEFGCTSAASGFLGWIEHWAAGKEWFDVQ